MLPRVDSLGIGLMVRFANDPKESFANLRAIGLRHCQFAAPSDQYLYGAEGRRNTRLLMNAMEEYDIASNSLFISFPNQNWNDWRHEIGLVPPATRAERLVRACRQADWGRELGLWQIASHVGAIPADSDDPVYRSLVPAVREFCRFLESNDQVLAYETGQEPVAVLARFMADVGADNQRINFDPANLLLYDHDDPAELVKTMGDKIVHVHCKDGNRPAAGPGLGRETRLGEGQTHFRELLTILLEQGYRGPLTIEREIASGKELDQDIHDAILLLEELRAPYLNKRKGHGR